MIAVVDYGAGNLFSVLNALEYLKIPAKLTAEKTELQQADAIILPGVGAFPDAMRMLNATGLTELLREEAQKKPFPSAWVCRCCLKQAVSLKLRQDWA